MSSRNLYEYATLRVSKALHTTLVLLVLGLLTQGIWGRALEGGMTLKGGGASFTAVE